MKSLFHRLLGGSRQDSTGETATVRKIVRRLDALEPERARWIAAFAYILGRVAFADLEISEEESRQMEKLVTEVGELPAEQALLVVEIAKAQNRLVGGTENFQVTKEFADLASRDEKVRLLHCLYGVASADDSISGQEEAQIRMIGDELGFSHREHIEIRRQYNEHRSVIQKQREK